MPTSVKVSVIVPVYKVETYLRRCLGSLRAQTLKEIEIICINDGAPDRSIDILREYEAQESRIKVIDLSQNQGVSAARNAGLDAAGGEFIGFIAPDCAVDLNFYETLYNKAQRAGADIAKGIHKRIGLDGRGVIGHDNRGVFDKVNEMVQYCKAYLSASLCSAIYSSSVIRQHPLRFPEGIHIGGGIVFQTCCMLASKKNTTSDHVFYYTHGGRAVADDSEGLFLDSRVIDSIRLSFNLIFDHTNRAFDAGKIDFVTYDTLYYNNLCFAVMIVLLTDDVHEMYECSELLVKSYRLCKRREQLDQKLQKEQSQFYIHLKEGDLKKLTRYFVEHYTLEDIVQANDARSTAYFQRYAPQHHVHRELDAFV